MKVFLSCSDHILHELNSSSLWPAWPSAPMSPETDSKLRMRIFKVWPVSSYRGGVRESDTWLGQPGPLIGRGLSVLASDWSMLPHHPCPASLGGALLVKSQISDSCHNNKSQWPLTSTMHLPFWLFVMFFFIYCCSFLFLVVWEFIASGF